MSLADQHASRLPPFSRAACVQADNHALPAQSASRLLSHPPRSVGQHWRIRHGASVDLGRCGEAFHEKSLPNGRRRRKSPITGRRPRQSSRFEPQLAVRIASRTIGLDGSAAGAVEIARDGSAVLAVDIAIEALGGPGEFWVSWDVVGPCRRRGIPRRFPHFD